MILPLSPSIGFLPALDRGLASFRRMPGVIARQGLDAEIGETVNAYTAATVILLPEVWTLGLKIADCPSRARWSAALDEIDGRPS